MRGRVPLRMRILSKLRPAPDWDSVTPEQFIEFRAAQDRLRGSVLLRPLTGRLERAARITADTLDLPGRRLNLRSTAYADRLRCAGAEVTLTRYPEATHAFLSMPGTVPGVRAARTEILDHLRHRLTGPPHGGQGSTAPAPGRKVRR